MRHYLHFICLVTLGTHATVETCFSSLMFLLALYYFRSISIDSHIIQQYCISTGHSPYEMRFMCLWNEIYALYQNVSDQSPDTYVEKVSGASTFALRIPAQEWDHYQITSISTDKSKWNTGLAVQSNQFLSSTAKNYLN